VVQALVNIAQLVRRFASPMAFNKLNTSNLQQFRVKMWASLVSRFRGRYITLSRLVLEHGNG
jgi:hypothetical protein